MAFTRFIWQAALVGVKVGSTGAGISTVAVAGGVEVSVGIGVEGGSTISGAAANRGAQDESRMAKHKPTNKPTLKNERIDTRFD
jgi:hypothetical protein